MAESTSFSIPGRRAGRWVGNALEKLEDAASSILIVAIFGLVVTQVFARYLLESPPFWVEELARTGMVWLTFIAAAFVTSKGAHLVMTMITDQMGRRASIIFTYIGEFVILLCAIIMVPAAWHVISAVGGVASSTGMLPRSALFMAPLIGFGLMAVHSLINILWRTPSETPAEVAL